MIHKESFLNDCNRTRTHNHLDHKQALNHLAKLAKWLSCVASTHLFGTFDCMFLSCHMCMSESIHTLSCLNVKELIGWNSHNIWSLSDSNPQPLSLWTNTQQFTKLAKWLSWIVSTICKVRLTIYSYRVTHAFQSKSTLYHCLNVKELIGWNSHNIWSLSDSNPQPLSLWTNTQQFTKLAKWLSWIVSTICKVRLTVYSYRVTHAFQSKSMLYHCLNVKELLARNRWDTDTNNSIYDTDTDTTWPVWLNV